MEINDGGSASYYELQGDPEELQDIIESKDMNFARGNIFKAAYRWGYKEGGDPSRDLRKILWFAERELKRIKGESCD